MAQITEYLFIDQRRLDSYVEQVHSPITYDKVPLWDVEASLSGPKVARRVVKPTRPLSNSEKIATLIGHLRKTKEFKEGRPNSPVKYILEPVFRWESCTATLLLLPQKTNSEPRAMKIWISDPLTDENYAPERTLRNDDAFPGTLFLMEDDPQPDNSSPGYVSAFSTLQLLQQYYDAESMRRLVSDEVLMLRADKRFAVDPISELRQIGAKQLSARPITILYRIRTGTEIRSPKGRTTVVTFAYPIVILDGNVSLDDLQRFEPKGN
jgi:hypothetical protein